MATTANQKASIKTFGITAYFVIGATSYHLGDIKTDSSFDVAMAHDVVDATNGGNTTPIKKLTRGLKIDDIELEVINHDKFVSSKVFEATELEATSNSNTETGTLEFRSKVGDMTEGKLVLFEINSSATGVVGITNPRSHLFTNAVCTKYTKTLNGDMTTEKYMFSFVADPTANYKQYIYGVGIASDGTFTDPTP